MSFLPAARVDLLEGLPVLGLASSQLTYTTIADGGSDGNLVTVDFVSALSIAYDALTGNVTGLENVVNADAQAAEANLPEGALVVLQMTDWQVPLFGSIGQQAADQINSAWTNGQIPMTPWAGNSQIAYYDPTSDTVSLYWIKGQQLIVYAVLGVMIALGALAVAGYVQGLLQQWGLVHAAPVSSTGGGPGTVPGIGGWWANLPFFDKVGIVVGGGAVVVGGLVFAAQYKIAEAGSGKSAINIYESGGRGGG